MLYKNDAILQNDFGLIAGIDEAGRGPLAGPVVVAAVCLDKDLQITGVNDSKKLTEKRREELFKEISKFAVAYKIVSVPHNVIDEKNILQATLWGMRESARQLKPQPSIFLIDGNKIPDNMPAESRSIIKGDSHHACIAAASILAKVTRDNIMREMHLTYPEYNFHKNKGYPTKEHLEALRIYGPCPYHRLTYGPVAQTSLDF